MTFGCADAKYPIEGRVVEAAELASGVLAEIHAGEGPGGKPIVGAEVKMFMELTDDGSPWPGTVWWDETTTRDDGTFELTGYGAPYECEPVGLRVTALGYEPLYATYVDCVEVEPQVFWVGLVPSESTGDAPVVR